MTRVAAIDCGTNSLRLLVADIDVARGVASDIVRRTEIVRLGEGVDRTGQFAPEALSRTFAVLDGYADLIADREVDAVRMVATSAARDVSNRAAFVAGVRGRVGVDPEVISGEDEARLSYDGATRDLSDSLALPRPWVVLDIGGGSTEIVTEGRRRPLDVGGSSTNRVSESLSRSLDVAGGSTTPGSESLSRSLDVAGGSTTPGSESLSRSLDVAGGSTNRVSEGWGRSLALGSVRLTERHLHSDPPAAAEVAAAERAINAELDTLGSELGGIGTLVGVAGSVTTLAALVLGLVEYRSEVVHHAWIDRDGVEEVTAQLLAMTVTDRRALPTMKPGRADVIAGGALILRAFVRRSGVAGLVVSEHDILDGIAWSLA